MSRISLDEAYARATKGPLKAAEAGYEECHGVFARRIFSISDAEVAPANGYGEGDEQAAVNAALLAHAFNVLLDVVEALERAVGIIEDIPYPGDYAAKELRDILARASTVEVAP